MKQFIFTKTNYILLGIALILIITGYLLMHGSSTEVTFNPDIFSFRRITLAPFVSMIGYGVLIAAIVWKDKKEKNV